MTRKNAVLYLASLCVLCAGYLLCRYVFFEVHGMKQWPACLFLLGLGSWGRPPLLVGGQYSTGGGVLQQKYEAERHFISRFFLTVSPMAESTMAQINTTVHITHRLFVLPPPGSAPSV